MKSFFKDFQEFINKGNVMDLAVAVVIGAAFTAIVNSIVNDLIMPLISLLTGGIDFSYMKVTIGHGEHAAAITYGNFISAVISFLIIALVVFLIVRAVNRMQKAAEKAAADAAKAAENAAGRSRLGKHFKGGAEEATAIEEPKPAPTCPFCLEEVKAGATRCPHCAGQFDAPAE